MRRSFRQHSAQLPLASAVQMDRRMSRAPLVLLTAVTMIAAAPRAQAWEGSGAVRLDYAPAALGGTGQRFHRRHAVPLPARCLAAGTGRSIRLGCLSDRLPGGRVLRP